MQHCNDKCVDNTFHVQSQHAILILFTELLKLNCDFYSASALLAVQSAVLARGILSVCLSLRPPRSGIVFRRMKIRSCGLQHLVGQSPYFLER